MSLERKNSTLENLHIASPCHASWDKMTGDDKARFCQTCQKNVFNLSMMTRKEAENLIRQREGNLCVQYAQREDGTVITNDCPVGMEKVKMVAVRPWRFFVAGAASIVAALCGALGITPTFAQTPTNPPAHSKMTKGDVDLKATTKVLRGEPTAIRTPTPKVITMGKPMMSATHSAPKPAPTPPPITLMGAVPVPAPSKTKAPVKPVIKKAPVKKTAKKR